MQSIKFKIKTLSRFIKDGKYKYIYASSRRRFIFYFLKRYFNNQLLRRKGSCSLKGHCCKIIIPECPYFKDGRCAIYDKQPLFCRIFPIDERDKKLCDVKELCSYYFD